MFKNLYIPIIYLHAFHTANLSYHPPSPLTTPPITIDPSPSTHALIKR
jgi:hypothetical protein